MDPRPNHKIQLKPAYVPVVGLADADMNFVSLLFVGQACEDVDKASALGRAAVAALEQGHDAFPFNKEKVSIEYDVVRVAAITPAEDSKLDCELPRGPKLGRFTEAERIEIEALKKAAFHAALPDPAAITPAAAEKPEPKPEPKPVPSVQELISDARASVLDSYGCHSILTLCDAVEAVEKMVREVGRG